MSEHLTSRPEDIVHIYNEGIRRHHGRGALITNFLRRFPTRLSEIRDASEGEIEIRQNTAEKYARDNNITLQQQARTEADADLAKQGKSIVLPPTGEFEVAKNVQPEQDLKDNAEFQELNTDIKYSVSLAIGGAALAGASVAATYEMVRGNYDPNLIGLAAPSGGFLLGAGLAVKTGLQSVSLIRRRNKLK